MNGEIRGLRWQFDSAPRATVLDAVFSRPWEAANKMAAGGQGRVRDYFYVTPVMCSRLRSEVLQGGCGRY